MKIKIPVINTKIKNKSAVTHEKCFIFNLKKFIKTIPEFGNRLTSLLCARQIQHNFPHRDRV